MKIFTRIGVSVWLVLITLAVLVAYGVTMGYGDDFELLFTVIAVRGVAGYGLGVVIGVVFWLATLLVRKESRFAGALALAMSSGSVVTIGLAILNLASA